MEILLICMAVFVIFVITVEEPFLAFILIVILCAFCMAFKLVDAESNKEITTDQYKEILELSEKHSFLKEEIARAMPVISKSEYEQIKKSLAFGEARQKIEESLKDVRPN